MAAPSRRGAIIAFYINGGVREIIPIYPLYAIMFGEHGVSPFELSLLFSIWALTGIIGEVPSGALADRYSRKWLVVTGGLLKSSAFLTWYLWQDFYGFAFGFVLWGSGSTLRSGAWEALLYDLLASWDRQATFARYYGRIKALALLGVGLGEITGGLLIINGYDFVLLVSMTVPLIASLPFAILVQDPPAAHSPRQRRYLGLLREGFSEALSSKPIRYIVCAYGLLLVAAGAWDEYVSPILFEKGFPLDMVAYLGAMIYFAQASGMVLAGRFSDLSPGHLLMVLTIATAFLIPVPLLGGYWTPVVIAIFFFAFGFGSTLFGAQLQHAIKGNARATVTSVAELSEGIGAIAWFMVFGALAEALGMANATTGFALLTILLCGIFYRLARVWGIHQGLREAPVSK
ncbi:MAG: MFS transporter [Pseudomonadales bacterium]|nr:MFS transporter [Pseudomonadales bacterium]